MKAAVVYSTLTGNTKKVAEAVLEGLGDGAEIFDVNAAPDPSEYDLVAVGFWKEKSFSRTSNSAIPAPDGTSSTFRRLRSPPIRP